MRETIDPYFENLKNPKHHDDLRQLQAFLRQQLPEATEDLTYGMPTYSQNDQVIVSMASQRNYMSLYMDMELVEQHRDQLGDLNCGKSCIRFKKLDDLPLDVIGTILKETIDKQRAG
ncbi:MAG: iron chaperone [Chloroflexota bacterium]